MMEYGHGGDIYIHGDLLDFSANINPFGTSEKVKDAAKRGIELSYRYPDSRSGQLKRGISESIGVPEETLIIGNGAADLLFTLILAERPEKALLPVPAFSEYEQSLGITDCRIRYHLLRRENQFRFTEDIIDDLMEDTDIVFFCSPSNPAGQTIEKELMLRIAEVCKERKIRIVLDECFIDFPEHPEHYDMTEELRNFPNVFMLRSFTKMHAMPGLRLGYGVTWDKELLEKMSRMRQPWSVSAPAQEAGLAALEEEERVRDVRKYLCGQREYMQKEMEKAGLEVIPSEANYILVHSRTELFGAMKEKGILIRDCSNYRGLGQGWYRMAVRRKEENNLLLKALREIMAEQREEKETAQ